MITIIIMIVVDFHTFNFIAEHLESESSQRLP